MEKHAKCHGRFSGKSQQTNLLAGNRKRLKRQIWNIEYILLIDLMSNKGVVDYKVEVVFITQWPTKL